MSLEDFKILAKLGKSESKQLTLYCRQWYIQRSFQGGKGDRWKGVRPQEGFVATSYDQGEVKCTE